MDDEEFSKIVALTDNLDWFALVMQSAVQGLDKMFGGRMTEIEGGLIEAGYSPLGEGSKKEMYDRVEDVRQDVLAELFFFDFAMLGFQSEFAAIADALDKKYDVRRRRSDMESRASGESSRQKTIHTEEN